MAKVTLLFGNDPQGDFPLDRPEVKIGRARDADIVVDNLGVSRHHCSIVQEGAGWKLVDKGSNNGTYLNGEKASEKILANGDRIILGKFSLVFDAHGIARSGGAGGENAAGAAGMGGEMTMFVDPEAIKKMQKDMGEAGAGTRMVLSVRSGERDIDCPLIKSDTTLGKGIDADVMVKGLLVKPVQAKIIKTDAGHRLISFGGLRKVKVNGIAVQEGVLRDGDMISIAGTRIVYKKA